MENVKKFLWGFFFIVVGLIWGLNAFQITNIDLFFDGWWTFFIIIPSFIGLFDEEEKSGNFIGLVIGIVLLLACQGILSFDVIGKLIVPIIFIMIGLSIILSNAFSKTVKEKFKNVNTKNLDTIVATFSEQRINITEKFKGVVLDAIFGGIDYDLRDATLSKENVIKATSIFGGITIRVADDVNVIVKSTSIFGGVDNKIKTKNASKTIYVDAICLFGGVDIK